MTLDVAGLKILIQGAETERTLRSIPGFGAFETSGDNKVDFSIIFNNDTDTCDTLNTTRLGSVLLHSFDLEVDNAHCSLLKNGDLYTVALWLDPDEKRPMMLQYRPDGTAIATPTDDPSLLRFALWMAFSLFAAPLGMTPIHASTIVHHGKAVLFLGESGTGKSTHTRLWLQHIDGCHLLNDDSPILSASTFPGLLKGTAFSDCVEKGPSATAFSDCVEKGPSATAFSDCVEKGLMVHGSPWSGKTPCYRNEHYPVAAIVRLSQAPYNKIERLSTLQALTALYPSCPPALAHDSHYTDLIVNIISKTLHDTPVYHLECLPDKAAALLSHNTIFPCSQAAQ